MTQSPDWHFISPETLTAHDQSNTSLFESANSHFSMAKTIRVAISVLLVFVWLSIWIQEPWQAALLYIPLLIGWYLERQNLNDAWEAMNHGGLKGTDHYRLRRLHFFKNPELIRGFLNNESFNYDLHPLVLFRKSTILHVHTSLYRALLLISSIVFVASFWFTWPWDPFKAGAITVVIEAIERFSYKASKRATMLGFSEQYLYEELEEAYGELGREGCLPAPVEVNS